MQTGTATLQLAQLRRRAQRDETHIQQAATFFDCCHVLHANATCDGGGGASYLNPVIKFRYFATYGTVFP